MIIAHISACFWLYLGHIEDHLPIEDRHTWLYNGFGDKHDQINLTWLDGWQEYVLALYWTLTVITSVGYGDYTGAYGNTDEYIFSILLEFTGMGVFAAMLYKTQEIV